MAFAICFFSWLEFKLSQCYIYDWTQIKIIRKPWASLVPIEMYTGILKRSVEHYE